ncbi:flagellin [Oceanospirillum multiglobuliferum]|uniref:Flagellin n=4 Tax=Oceanospirillum multiglobuliferum TaxID=64969 RepID=A0A1V4T4G4_9GAMM|nr:flagellin [Oceanospirillum multiglobuliferum]OPX54824.1 hypothetical protein BTE48_12445 [Oceanospirillum multiglobuliferum]
MALFVNTNVAALNGQKNLSNVTSRMNSSFEKLSSGSRINSAKDDAAGLQIADRLTTQIIGLQQGTRNANDGISIAQIAEGALGEVTNNLQRMRQLVIQGGNRTLSTDDREALSQEFIKLLDVNNDIADRTAFGTRKILNEDSPTAGFQIQSGAQSGEQDTVTTGNSKLTALFGRVATDETTSANTLSAMDSTNVNTFGTIGKLVAAYVATGNAATFSAAFTAVIGETQANIGTNHSGMMASDLGNNPTSIVMNVSALTATLQNEALNSVDFISNYEAAGGGGISLFDATLIASTIGDLSALSGDELNALHAFATDALLDAMTALVTQVDKQRAKLGAEQNGLASTIRSNAAGIVNVSDSRSRITDTDFAMETAELTRNQIIQQASTSILSQANQLPQAALSLLGN